MDIPHNQCVFWGQDWKYEIPIYLMSKPFKMQSHMANGIALSIWCRLERYAKCNKSRTVDFVSIYVRNQIWLFGFCLKQQSKPKLGLFGLDTPHNQYEFWD